MDEEMSVSKKARLLKAACLNISTPETNEFKRQISEASYTLGEGGAWPDAVDSVSVEQIILAHRLVEYLKANDFMLDKEFRL